MTGAADAAEGMAEGAVGDWAWLERACLGEALPAAAEQHLRQAGQSALDPAEAEKQLQQALAAAPRHVAVYIACYRYYFYRGRIAEALPYAELCLGAAADILGLSREWRKVDAGGADFGDFNAYATRFYLFSLKAYGYLLMRLGRLDEGEAAMTQVMALDPADRVGAAGLLAVSRRRGWEDDD